MGPLIDKKLQDIDEQHAELEDVNLKILEAFQLYNNLMKESISKQTALINSSQIQVPSMNSLGMGGTTNGAISYAAAPPSLEANSINFANKLNSMAGYAQLPPNNGFASSMGGNPGGFATSGMNSALNMQPGVAFPGQYLGSANGGLVNSAQSTNGGAGSSPMPGLASGVIPGSSQPQMATYGNYN